MLAADSQIGYAGAVYRIEENMFGRFGDPVSFVLLDATDTVVRIGPSVDVLADIAFDVLRADEVTHNGYVIREAA